MEELICTKANPYHYDVLFKLDTFCLFLMRCYRYAFDAFLSSFFPVTPEREHLYLWICRRIIYMPVICLWVLLTLPVALVGQLIWLTFQHKKSPYRLSIATTELHKSPELDAQKQSTFVFATTNLCLLPESLSRFNNQTNPVERCKHQGENIAKQQFEELFNQFSKKNKTINGLKTICDIGQFNVKNINSEPSFDVSIKEGFPLLDILCVQETFVKEYAEGLLQHLHRVFPYVVYDAGYNSWTHNCFLSSSGLMIASRFPFLEVRFNSFRAKMSQCRFASKGLLQVKVLISESDTKRYVGYVFNTHLQAYQGSEPIHTEQLNDIHRWAQRFRDETLQPGETVLFDVLAGDFNLDNMSPVDREDWNHPLFELYTDLGRERAGKDHSWCVGTEMAHTPIHDALIQTPVGLKQALQDPLLLQYYVMDADFEHMHYNAAWLMPETDKEGKQKWHPRGGKRRIDYVMYRTQDTHVRPLAFNAVTQLAGLTDHIPYSLTVDVSKAYSK